MLSLLKKSLKVFTIIISTVFIITGNIYAQTATDALKIIIIRHGEKPVNGDNLNCQGLNRSQLLPAVITSKFGIPLFSYVPSLTADSATKHARMFQTITPLAAKYNLIINSKFNGKDTSGLATDILKRYGEVLVVWDHKMIVPITNALGVTEPQLKWNDDDFDSIWIITFQNGKVVLTKDKEGLTPAADCR